jgi:hypothetical protein
MYLVIKNKSTLPYHIINNVMFTRAVSGSPRAVSGSPRAVSGSPRAVSGSPRTVSGSN